MALFFLDFPSLRTDSFLDNIAPRHISVLKFLFLKAVVVSPVVCFALATSIGAMDVRYCQMASVQFVYHTV